MKSASPTNSPPLKSLAFAVGCWNTSNDDQPVNYANSPTNKLPRALRSWKRMVLIMLESRLHDAFQQAPLKAGSPMRRATLFGSVLQTYCSQAPGLVERKTQEYHFIGEDKLIKQRAMTSRSATNIALAIDPAKSSLRSLKHAQ